MNKLVNKERGIIVADNAISLTFAPNSSLDSGFFIYLSKISLSVVDLDFSLKKVDKYLSSLAFVGGLKDVERFPCEATAGGHCNISYGSASSQSDSARLLTVKYDDHILPMYNDHNIVPTE